MAVILRYFSEFDNFRGALRKKRLVEDIPKLSAIQM